MNSTQADEKFAAYCHTLGVACEVKPLGKQANIPDVEFWGGSPNDFTTHETANEASGASALMHWQFVKNGGGPELASFNLCVDRNGVVVIVSLNKGSYHAGVTAGNYDSMSLEICVNDPLGSAGWAKTQDNAARVTAAALAVWGLPTSKVRQHFTWYGKNCPARLRKKGWAEYLVKVEEYRVKLLSPAPDMPIHFPETGQSISGGFKVKWLEYGLPVLGYPITSEFQQEIGGKVYTFQKFENCVLQWSAGMPVTFSGTVARAHAKHPEEV